MQKKLDAILKGKDYKIVAKRYGNIYLMVDEAEKNGRVIDAMARILYPETEINTLLALGGWEPAIMKDEDMEELLLSCSFAGTSEIGRYRVIGKRGEGTYLVADAKDKKPGKARIYEASSKHLHPWASIGSILKFGYWEDFKATVEESDEILDGAVEMEKEATGL